MSVMDFGAREETPYFARQKWPSSTPRRSYSGLAGFFLFVASCRNGHLGQVPRGRRHTRMSGKRYAVNRG